MVFVDVEICGQQIELLVLYSNSVGSFGTVTRKLPVWYDVNTSRELFQTKLSLVLYQI